MASQDKANVVELDDLKEQFAALRTDMKEMADMISFGVAERAAGAKDEVASRAMDLKATAEERASQLQTDAERAIARNPLAAIAVFAGIGYLLGVVSRR